MPLSPNKKAASRRRRLGSWLLRNRSDRSGLAAAATEETCSTNTQQSNARRLGFVRKENRLRRPDVTSELTGQCHACGVRNDRRREKGARSRCTGGGRVCNRRATRPKIHTL